MNPKDTRLTFEAIEGARDKLSQEQYAALLQWADGQKYADIARHLDIPQGTVKSRINRGRTAVAKFSAERTNAG